MEDIITVVAARASQARDRSDRAIRTSTQMLAMSNLEKQWMRQSRH